MTLIEARKRLDVTGMDIGEQGESPYILLYNEMPFAIDEYQIDGYGTLRARRGDDVVVAFNARRALWLVINRKVTKLASKEEIAEAAAGLQKLQEEMFAKYHPDEFKAYQQQRARHLGLDDSPAPGGTYL
jgi:hypothetical protein